MSRKTRFQYKSRRERLQRDMKNIKTITIFLLIGAAIWIFMRRQEIWWWLESLWFRLT